MLNLKPKIIYYVPTLRARRKVLMRSALYHSHLMPAWFVASPFKALEAAGIALAAMCEAANIEAGIVQPAAVAA